MRRTAVITDAQGATSAELSRRQKRYVITMLFRLACFIGIFFVSDIWRWVLGACAVFLPYIAVILANQADTRRKGGSEAQPDLSSEPDDNRPELEQFVVIEPDEGSPDHDPSPTHEPRADDEPSPTHEPRAAREPRADGESRQHDEADRNRAAPAGDDRRERDDAA